MMPEGGAEARAEQMAALDVVCHGMLADPALGDLLHEAGEEARSLDPWQRANLAEMRRLRVHATALDPGLVEALAKASGRAESVWRKARPAGDYALAKPVLETLLGLVREAATAKADALGVSPYEALIDEFEPGLRVSEIDRLFDGLAGFLPNLREAALARQAKRPAPIRPKGPFPEAAQQALGRKLIQVHDVGVANGRIDDGMKIHERIVASGVLITLRN